MATNLNESVPALSGLPVSFPRDAGVEIELEEGVLIFRVSRFVQERIEELLDRQREAKLTAEEEQELQQYEDIDDYLSFINRLSRNISSGQRMGFASYG